MQSISTAALIINYSNPYIARDQIRVIIIIIYLLSLLTVSNQD